MFRRFYFSFMNAEDEQYLLCKPKINRKTKSNSSMSEKQISEKLVLNYSRLYKGKILYLLW